MGLIPLICTGVILILCVICNYKQVIKYYKGDDDDNK